MEFDIELINEETAVKLLKREVFYRKTDAFQRLYDRLEYYTGSSDEFVETTIQKLVLEEHGYLTSTSNLINYRMIAQKFAGSQRVIDSAFYLKYNIMKDHPVVKLNEPVCNVALLDLQKQPTDLFGLLDRKKPTVILAGSIT